MGDSEIQFNLLMLLFPQMPYMSVIVVAQAQESLPERSQREPIGD